MSRDDTAEIGLIIGLGLGDKYSEGCVVDVSGEGVETFRVRTTQPALVGHWPGSGKLGWSWRWGRTLFGQAVVPQHRGTT